MRKEIFCKAKTYLKVNLYYICECSCIWFAYAEAQMFKFLDSFILFSNLIGIIDIHADHSKCGLLYLT